MSNAVNNDTNAKFESNIVHVDIRTLDQYKML